MDSDWMGIYSTVSVLCGTVLAFYITYTIRSIMVRRTEPAARHSSSELKQLREEIVKLRQENHDLVLGLDTAMQRLEHRLGQIETRGTLGMARTASEASESSVLSRTR